MTDDSKNIIQIPWKYFLASICTVLLMLGLLIHSLLVGRLMTTKYTPLLDACMEIKMETTTAHLWFEEIVGGGKYVDIDKVQRHIDTATWYANAMLEGGQNQEGTFIALEDLQLRNDIKEVLSGLMEFSKLLKDRYGSRLDITSGIDSDIDQRFDATFIKFIQQVDNLETNLQELMSNKLRIFTIVQFVLIFTILGISIVIFVAIYRYEKLRVKDFATIEATNEQLKKEITERKQTEKELKEAHDFTNNIVEKSLDAIVVSDSQGIITRTNKAYQKLLSFSEKELLGKHTAELSPSEEGPYESTTGEIVQVSEAFYLSAKNMVEELFEKKHVYNRKVYLLRKDRTMVPVEENIVLLTDINGEPAGAVGILRDITSRIQAKKEKEMLQVRLNRAEKMETIGTLAGGVAHDLNNILGAIVGYPELILDDIPKDSPLRSSILAIKESGERAVSVIQDLLTLARRGISVSEVENLNNIITDYFALPEFHKLKEFHPDVSVETNLATDLLNISGSSVHLLKVVMNLVSNAAEAMPKGGKIIVSTENMHLDRVVKGYDKIEEGDYALLTVSDEGIGISEKDLKRIFEPFYSKKVIGRSGTGLGMAVIWGTIKDHKGYIDVESKEGIGTTFKLYFPVTRNKIKDRDKHVPTEKYVGSGEKVLIIDDVKAQREIASNMLTRLNYNTRSVKSGEEAIEYLKNNSADILLLDMIMDPGIDGLETYKRILELHPRQKAVIASGFSETDRVSEVRELGASTFIKKPYTLEKIGLAIKAELKNNSV